MFIGLGVSWFVRAAFTYMLFEVNNKKRIRVTGNKAENEAIEKIRLLEHCLT